MASSQFRWRSLVVLCCTLLIGLAGCGDSDDSGITGVEGEEGEQEGDPTSPSASDDYFMFAAAGADVEGEVTGDVELKIYLYDRDTSDPVDNAQVSFEVLDDEDESAPSLSVRNLYTDSDGSATVDAMLGTEEGAWTVRANNSSSNAVDFQVVAGAAEAGTVEVTPVNASPTLMTLSDIDVRIYRESHFECEYFQPLGPQDDDTLGEEFTQFTDNTVTFDNLGTSNRYVVTAVARGDQGQVAAGGCVSSVIVEHDKVTDVEVLLQLVPLNPTGTYSVLSNWDFTEALAESGPAGSVIVRVLDIFENPGEAIYSEIIELIATFVGGLISETINTFLSLTGLDDTFQNMINDFIDGNDGLSQVRDAGRDLRDVVADLEVHSELSIGKLASDFEFRGQDNWLGITMYWTWGCEESDGPDCGAIELKADDDGEFSELGVLSSDWTGRVAAYNQLHIDQHTVSLRYGRLIMYALNDVILPTVTDDNANSMSEAFSYWFGCDSLVDSLIPDGEVCAAGYCLAASTVEDACETAVSAVFGFADLLIDNLEFDMGLRLGGEGRLIEETSDGLVDRINEGIFSGYIEDSSDGTPTTSSFDAIWEGERVSNTEL